MLRLLLLVLPLAPLVEEGLPRFHKRQESEMSLRFYFLPVTVWIEAVDLAVTLGGVRDCPNITHLEAGQHCSEYSSIAILTLSLSDRSTVYFD